MSSIDDGGTSSTAVIPRGGYSCAVDDMKWMIFHQESIRVPRRFPRLFLIRENPVIALRCAQNPCSPSSHLVCCGNASSSQFMAGCKAIRPSMVASQAAPARPFSRSIIIFLVRPCPNGWVPFIRVHLGNGPAGPRKVARRTRNIKHDRKRRTTDAGPRTTAPRKTSIPTTTEQLQLLGRRPH